MNDRSDDLPITKQAKAPNISRGSVYHLPRAVPEVDLAIMRRLDRLHLEFPFAGSRILRGLLAADGYKIGRRHVTKLMKQMAIEVLYRHPRTTKPEPGHKIYPNLLRGMAITRPNRAWAMDITYILMARGFVYLAVLLDWFCRRVLSWRLSTMTEAAFCVETLENALARHGKPDIFNTDQGSQFTGSAFVWRVRRQRHCDQHGRQSSLAGQCVRRAVMAQCQIRGGCNCGPTTASARPALQSADIWTFTTADVHTRALTARTGSSLLQLASTALGGLTPADPPLIEAEELFRQPGPPHCCSHNRFDTKVQSSTSVGMPGELHLNFVLDVDTTSNPRSESHWR